MNETSLSVEIINGPLDGYVIKLETETLWGNEGEGLLSFPWDTELGSPQARFFPDDGHWWLETYTAGHSTYCINRQERVEGRLQVEAGDIFKASNTWLSIIKIEELEVESDTV